jgi:hypothetical protein
LALPAPSGPSPIIGGAQVVDHRVIDAQIKALESPSPEAWQNALQSLKAYPLCGRVRCQRLLCGRLGWLYGNVPAALDDAFKQTFGKSTTETCWKLLDIF